MLHNKCQMSNTPGYLVKDELQEHLLDVVIHISRIISAHHRAKMIRVIIFIQQKWGNTKQLLNDGYSKGWIAGYCFQFWLYLDARRFF